VLLAAAALCALALTGALAGCGAGAEPQPLVFTEAQSGDTVTAAVGDVIEVRVAENPSTGYQWTFTASGGLGSHGDAFISPSASPQVVGAPGTREVTFVVTGPGEQQIIGVYARPWEFGPGPSHPDFKLTIAVE
jgi:inhibitor of cysteine peptidase